MGCMVKGRNEPCKIGQVLYVLAAIREVDAAYLADVMWENTNKLFFSDS